MLGLAPKQPQFARGYSESPLTTGVDLAFQGKVEGTCYVFVFPPHPSQSPKLLVEILTPIGDGINGKSHWEVIRSGECSPQNGIRAHVTELPSPFCTVIIQVCGLKDGTHLTMPVH